ncbi:MAG: amidohydrolase family protein, partial [Acidimicrobiales bacterium]
MIPKIISADDHVIEPAHVWQDRMPSKHKELAPKIVIAPQGEMTLNDGVWLETPGTGDKMAAWWHFENKRYQIKQMVACPGIPPEEVTMEGVTYDDIAPGCYDPIARLADMDINHVEASLCFPNYPRFCGQLFSEADDLELGLLCVQAYNDWMIDEWCGSSGGRLIPLCIVPLWDAELAAKEIYRVAEKGCRAVA